MIAWCDRWFVAVYLFANDMFGKRIALITGAIASIYPGLFIYDGWLYSDILLAPWTLRNYKATHTFILVATGGGNVLSGVYNDTALKEDGMWEPLVNIRPEIDFHGHNCCDYTGEADNTAYALHWISTHISSMPYLLSLHFINMWKPYTSEEGLPFIEFPTRISSRVVWNMIFIVSFPIFLLAAFGLLVTWKRWKKYLFVVYVVIALNIIQNVAFYGSSRFRAPIEPLLVLLVGGAIWWLTCNEPGTRRYNLRKKAGREGLQVTSPVSFLAQRDLS